MPRFPHDTILPCLLRDLAHHASDRRPDGGSCGGFRHHIHDGVLWLMPRHLAGIERAATRAGTAPLLQADKVSAYWLAHALRQDTWRALRGLRGVLPVAAVSLHHDGVGETPVLIGALLPRGRRLAPGSLDRVLHPPTLARHARWASVQARARAY